MTIAVFGGPWETGYPAQDGAIYGFADAEYAVRQALGNAGHRIVTLDITDFLGNNLARRLAGVDIVYANCGPIAALLFHLREAMQLNISIYREVRTLGWIGYAFQEFIARELRRPQDRCLHVSHYAAQIWNGIRPHARDCVFYPLLRQDRQTPAATHNGTLHCGYFSRACSDKGLGYVPAIIGRLLDGGWAVTALSVCGAPAEPELLDRCRAELSGMGVTVNHLGELGYRATLESIAAIDIVLFPSVSSIEAAGRVVLEAYNLGKRVIASDYCWGADLLTAGFRIPLSLLAPVTGSSTFAFPIADLAVERWQAPAWEEENFAINVCEQFRYNAERVEWLLSPAADPPDPCRPPTIEMRFDWNSHSSLSGMAWCDRVYGMLAEEYRDRNDLLDLGGAFKRSLRRAGFEPDVCFQPTAKRLLAMPAIGDESAAHS